MDQDLLYMPALVLPGPDLSSSAPSGNLSQVLRRALVIWILFLLFQRLLVLALFFLLTLILVLCCCSPDLPSLPGLPIASRLLQMPWSM